MCYLQTARISGIWMCLTYLKYIQADSFITKRVSTGQER